MEENLKNAVNIMVKNLVKILGDNIKSIYIYGSSVLNDFKLGWSDIDILVLTKKPICENEAEVLLNLRQTLLNKEPENLYFRSFEGAMLSYIAFLGNTQDNVVYWGTKGQKIKENYKLDSFSMKELIENGRLLYGEDVRDIFIEPTFQDLKNDIQYHYESIRQHAQKTGRNFYSFGWFLDISRCLYTLETGKIISKTKAGEWAIKNNLCPDKIAIKTALKVRKNPLKYKNDEKIFDYAETLGNSVQEYANVLEKVLKNFDIRVLY